MTGIFILFYILYAILLFLLKGPFYLLIISLPVLFLYIKLPAKINNKGIYITLLFGLFIFIANQLHPEGKIIFKKNFIVVADDSLKNGFERAMRLIILVMAAKVLLWKFSAEELLKGFERLLGPLGKKKAVQNFIETGLLTLKALPGVSRELHKEYSEKCKSGSLIYRVKTVGLIIVTVLSKAINRPEEFF
ncbi:MAG: CbiQ family ECF transporter T component [Thermodesulfovibrionales bacterium]|nr:CbiQ family ECF transporter T component [Thermodesulfovibrionales bacterium]